MSLKKICLILIEENDNLKCTRNANHINALFLLVINMTTNIRFLQYQICQAFVKVFVAFLSALSLHSCVWGKIPKYIIERDNDFLISNTAYAILSVLNQKEFLPLKLISSSIFDISLRVILSQWINYKVYDPISKNGYGLLNTNWIIYKRTQVVFVCYLSTILPSFSCFIVCIIPFNHNHIMSLADVVEFILLLFSI